MSNVINPIQLLQLNEEIEARLAHMAGNASAPNMASNMVRDLVQAQIQLAQLEVMREIAGELTILNSHLEKLGEAPAELEQIGTALAQLVS